MDGFLLLELLLQRTKLYPRLCRKFRTQHFCGSGVLGFRYVGVQQVSYREKAELQFRAEAFNLLNHTNFQLGNNRINGLNFGQARSTFDPRNLQFGAKLSF